MKSIVCVNIDFPTIDHVADFDSETSLRDHDIIVFYPSLRYYDRVHFSAGGSCLSIEDTSRFKKASAHWSRELNGALAAGKTVFVVLNSYEEDSGAVSSTSTSKSGVSYQTTAINNYGFIPGRLHVRNARGQKIVVKDSAFKGLHDAISGIAEYRVVFESSTSMRTVFTAKDETAVGGVVSFQDWPGSLVLVPHFDFQSEEFSEESDEEGEVWSEKAMKVSHAVVGQLVAIDRMLKASSDLTPPPEWLSSFNRPKAIDDIENVIADIDAQIEELYRLRDEQILKKADNLEYSYVLYETGKPLEGAIEKVLRLLGYSVETLRVGDLEIDHVIVAPNGSRMIGESEGKDTSAIDISKFRQLESNIGEDFEREEISNPAKGVLFGNGFRLSPPATRAEQFTQKSLTNASRLGSALIRTPDLYAIAVHLLDHPEDDAFRAVCRAAIETTSGGIVSFPNPLPGQLAK